MLSFLERRAKGRAVTGDDKIYLDRFPVFETDKPEAARHALLNSFKAKSFDTSGRTKGFRAQGNHAQLEYVSLSYCSYDADVRVAFPELDAIRQQFCLHGHATTSLGRNGARFGSGHSFIIPSKAEVDLDFSESYRQVVLRVEGEFLDKKLQSLLGLASPKPLEFRNPADFNDPRSQTLLPLVLGFANQLNDTRAALPRPVLDELQQSLAVAFLFLNRHNLSHLLEDEPPDAAQRVVKTVEEFIEANWNSTITIESLMAITGTSARSIFREFKKRRGYTPMMFAKRVRLKQARSRLLSPEESTSVTGVALACGFLNQGHFARDYREAFGELPSASLARARPR